MATLSAAILAVDGVRNLTGTPAALQLAASELTNNDRNDTQYPDVVLFISDGLANVPVNDTFAALVEAADALKAEAE